MKHKDIGWNSATHEWFCLACGRTSDHSKEPDARIELEQFACSLAYLEMPKAVSASQHD